jgi:hypothetical protein
MALFRGSVLFGAGSEGEQTWLARFNGGTITVQEFQDYLREQCSRNPDLKVTPARRRELLNTYLEKKVLLAEADRLGLAQAPAVIKDFQEAKQQILLKHLLDRQGTELGKKVKITDKEIRRYYAGLGREIRFRYLMLADPGHAQEALAGWQGHNAPPGTVDSGMVSLASLDDAWKAELDKLPLRNPRLVMINSQPYIVEVLEKKDVTRPPLDQVREEINGELLRQKKAKMLQGWISQLKEKYNAKINSSYYQH